MNDNNNLYKLSIFKLVQAMQKGGEPNYGECNMIKSPWMMEWTEKVQMIYNQQTMKFDDEDSDIINIKQHDIDQGQELSKEIKDSVKRYYDIDGNKKEFRNPMIVIDDEPYKRNEIIERRILGDEYPINELRGGHGTFTIDREIPKNTIIGEYMGSMMTEKEWTQIFSDSRKDISNRAYIFSFEVKTNDGIARIFIDPIESNMDKGDSPMILLYINDIRKNIMNRKATKKDQQRENARFLVVRINGWPKVFVITTKNISKNKEILIDYGDGYYDLMWEQITWKRMLNATKKTSNHILHETIGETEANNLSSFGVNVTNPIHL